MGELVAFYRCLFYVSVLTLAAARFSPSTSDPFVGNVGFCTGYVPCGL